MGKESNAMNAAAGKEIEAADRGDSTEKIRGDIAETRAQLSETIDEIQERLNPHRLMQDAKETVRDATVGKVSDMMNDASESVGGIVDRIKENPLPAAAIGVGAWWLFGKQGQRRPSDAAGRYTPRPRNGGERHDLAEWGADTPSGGVVGTLKQHPVPAALAGLGLVWWLIDRQRGGNDVSPRYVGQYYGDAVGAGDSQTRKLREMANDATDAVTDAAERTQERIEDYAERAQTELDRLLRDNPLALGAVAVAVGAAIGMAVPETRGEQQLIGGVRDQIVDKAKDLADNAADTMKEMASNLSADSGRSKQ